MSECHFFSNICPKFSVFDLEKYITSYGLGSNVELSKLLQLGLFESARWLTQNSFQWESKKKKIEGWIKKTAKSEGRILYWGTPEYPRNLKSLSWPPALLFIRGSLPHPQSHHVAIVGSRSPTDIGVLWVQGVVPKLTKENIVIVSGGARGIDGEAHGAALESGGETVCFLPGSVGSPYPKHNIDIFEKILDKGALLSEFPPDTEVRRENFYRRNRLIAGMADVVIIVEAAEKSGTLLTAHKALDENRDVLVVPGPPLVASYSGSLELLTQGAGVARDEKDIILCLERKNVLKSKEETPTLW